MEDEKTHAEKSSDPEHDHEHVPGIRPIIDQEQLNQEEAHLRCMRCGAELESSSEFCQACALEISGG